MAGEFARLVLETGLPAVGASDRPRTPNDARALTSVFAIRLLVIGTNLKPQIPTWHSPGSRGDCPERGYSLAAPVIMLAAHLRALLSAWFL